MKSKLVFVAALTGALMATAAPTAEAGPDEYIGEILTVGFNFCPRGTMEADGRLLPISANTALFSLFGTMYGGDGRTTFALPDLRASKLIAAPAAPNISGNNNPAASKTKSQPVLKKCVVTEGIFPSRS